MIYVHPVYFGTLGKVAWRSIGVVEDEGGRGLNTAFFSRVFEGSSLFSRRGA